MPRNTAALPHTLYEGTSLINTQLVPDFQVAFFDPDASGLNAEKVGSGGRQAAWFVTLPSGEQGVLRHYRRGGLIAKLIRDRYVWTGASQTRSWSEYAVMLYLSHKLDCVPPPLAATYQRSALLYRAAIIVKRIPRVQPLADVLESASPSAVAEVILAVHDAGVWHADLNAYNVLLNEAGQVWIIDFDRARRVEMSNKQRQNNLQRLCRSLVKVHGEQGLAWWSEMNRVYLQHQHAAIPNRD
ncbi:3-deoxy-D-manno-octulosonic acid kinase [Paenalcaligenes niemegkensis]|uniref:3-deoxy-D-manno-octulosonic acid kinase n=1 Tax=Paenalcaligenes niemegkensis TaxID=2895469 RepID=UPI001EE93073|nr:3-deoxy-D-manno-octulosonic acid kinase [Paenalcaligenes niemegkensis]MCQ9615626.1 3-deoxy-D-manno-octulosonic acid kinase [Paenalcaligenes niemegkensis]